MLDADTKGGLASIEGVFHFEVGPERARFTLHKNRAKESKRLKEIMAERSQEGFAVLERVDAFTFGRFEDFVYTKDYSFPNPEPKTITPEEESVGEAASHTEDVKDAARSQADAASNTNSREDEEIVAIATALSRHRRVFRFAQQFRVADLRDLAQERSFALMTTIDPDIRERVLEEFERLNQEI
ncbi:uncharacterized protein K452DRAFT_313216 [Aplosporella prunicola CBS 121167]|uniref:BTB domain-containing protein n=1 Tax=Aplosporella prunicola CBS 121167 TaxID=1176127 RepID=A0A6A6B046_9PEZI|nr:uncharacterized protein K452DRAFT_313216 [Aplosporella prunicola CBS 121167]KAF2136407.1 hypothetical protein K452DRAFT_313216 [Aplosporella prunicola CBS 121167]